MRSTENIASVLENTANNSIFVASIEIIAAKPIWRIIHFDLFLHTAIKIGLKIDCFEYMIVWSYCRAVFFDNAERKVHFNLTGGFTANFVFTKHTQKFVNQFLFK